MGPSDDKIKTYNPHLSREFSSTSNSDPEEQPMASDAQAFITQPVKRGKSLVRPERERIDPNHRQYHYRQAAGQAPDDTIQASKTGNLPRTLSRKGTTKSVAIRRGKSILGREEKAIEDDFAYAQEEQKPSCWNKLPRPWMLYCYVLTFWIPPFVLKICGIPYGQAQTAWREKIGLVAVILVIMAFVGFLTFGFTAATCPLQPVTVHGNEVTPGYLIIKGWAYSLSDWQDHPPINGGNETMNVLYPPMNGSGMDASFLFPSRVSACDNVFVDLQGQQPNYFPCQLFNPNHTVAPDASLYTNRTNCHTSDAANSLLNTFATQGVPNKDGAYNKISRVYYNYEDVNTTSHLMIYNGHVLNLALLQSLPTTYFQIAEGGLVDRILKDGDSWGGKDMTYVIQSYRGSGLSWKEEAECLSQTIRVGQIDTISVGCMFSDIVLYVSLVVILAVIGAKFVFAVIFGWFLSWKLGNFEEENSFAARREREKQIENWTRNINTNGPVTRVPPPPQTTQPAKRKSLFPRSSRFTPMQHGPNRFDFDKPPMPVWKNNGSRPDSYVSASTPSFFNSSPSHRGSYASFSTNNNANNGNNYITPAISSYSWDGRSSDSASVNRSSVNGGVYANGPPCPFPLSPYCVPQPPPDYMPFNYPLAYTMCLVTCYSEGEEGIRTTLDSIAVSDYPKSHTMLLVICDGLITGSGESRSTPDVCVGMMRDLIVPADEVKPQPYVAIGDGAKGNNCAKVYAGFYKFDDETVPVEQQSRVPMITIVKCGTEEEQDAPKPGNRGKRDSQVLLMQFLQKVMFDERMTMMEYDFFNAIWRVTGVPADNFEICLMVDADTKLYPDALSRLISAAVKDPEISGLCGETRIANKKDSWVSMIQVFEYYISHHQSKAFESIFGGVTCLPGCFCMYRIKAPKGPNGYWVPILANPDIVQHYSENIVDTLHRKNLLLLGEDRYLTTLMLRTFPNRKMMFIPQAVCKTVVPDTFKVLLSQRRRWINSTVHNLFELLLVNDLCGTFCFSMQAVVFMELVGTLTLPAAISFTLYLVIEAIMGNPAVVPLVLLALILGLPAVLIVITSRKIVYVGWMIIYLLSLPIWNFALPAYAFWHFDDFSWGDTRKVEGIKKDQGHGGEGGNFDSSVITMKKWSEYEMERRTKLAQENNLPAPRFAERNMSVDVFRENELYDVPNRRYSDQSSGSAGIPLTQQMDHGMRYRHTGGAGDTSATPLGIIPARVQLSDSSATPANYDINEIMKPGNNSNEPLSDESTESHELGWIQQSSQGNNWADPAPHHNHAHFTDDVVVDVATTDNEAPSPSHTKNN
ncbi:Chitin synthase, class 3 [Mucor circinelloides]